MLLTLDIGNTNINAGLWDGKKLRKRFYFPGPITSYIKNVDECIIVSVCPEKLKIALTAIRRYYKGKIRLVGKDLKVPLRSAYDPRQIGQDRLVTAYAASLVYGTPVLIIDFGTAVTFDMVSENDVYLGGLIFPGIKMSLESLHTKTALLPEVDLRKPKGFIGKNTETSIRNGIIYGYKSVAEGIIKEFKNISPRIRTIVTGGNAELIKDYTGSGRLILDENLCLYGLQKLAEA